MATPSYGTVPFAEQAEFFRRKLNLPTNAWTDIYGEEHDWAFVVAGANRDEIVADFRAAVEKAIERGTSLEEFRRDFDTIVARYGWDYNGGRNWRSRVIYETNLRSSYAAGRWEQLQAVKGVRPWWMYVHSDAVQHPRPHHLALDGKVWHADDPVWQYYFGPNGWGCQCTVRALNERDLRRMGKTPDPPMEIKFETHVIGQRSPGGPREVKVPEGIDPGFAHAPNRARLRSAIPPEIPDPPIAGSGGGPGLPNLQASDPLSPPRVVSGNRLLPDDLSDDGYLARFLREFGATAKAPVVFRDVLGEGIVIGKELFEGADGESKIRKRGREQFLLLLADAIRNPDEIWARIEWVHAAQRSVVRRRYIARFLVEDQDGATPAVAVFERGSDGWWGVTAYPSVDRAADSWRVGVRLYQRGDE